MEQHSVIVHSLQWADVLLKDFLPRVKEWGYDGVELGCRGDHFDPHKALESDRYVRDKLDLLEQNGLRCLALSDHLTGACVCDYVDDRYRPLVPARVWGDGKPEGVSGRAAEEMKRLAAAASALGVPVVVSLTGSKIWRDWYPFPPRPKGAVERGFDDFAERWLPILDAYRDMGVKLAIEVHAAQIAYDILTAERAVKAVDNHLSFGFNLDPSHLVYQFVNPVRFVEALADRIFHVHIKDARLNLDGRRSILSSHLDWGESMRGWDFVSPGRGDVKWDLLIRALNQSGYSGPLSVEAEDALIDRDYVAREALEMIRKVDYVPSTMGQDDAWASSGLE